MQTGKNSKIIDLLFNFIVSRHLLLFVDLKIGPTLIVEFFRKKLKHSAASTGLSASFCEMFGTGLVLKAFYYCRMDRYYV